MTYTKLSDAQANALILERRNKDRATWDEIAKELSQKGYKNKKKSVIPPMTVRYRYYQMTRTGDVDLDPKSKLRAAPEAQRQLELIEKVLQLDADDKSKIKIIESMFEND